MSVAADAGRRPIQRRSPWPLVWLLVLVAILLVLRPADDGLPLPSWLSRNGFEAAFPWAYSYPRELLVPLQQWIGGLVGWAITSFMAVTRLVTTVTQVPLNLTFGLLERGFKFGVGAEATVIPPLSWLGVTAAAALIGRAYGGWRLALLLGVSFLYLALFNQWTSAVRTLALVSVAIPLSAVFGILVGIWGYRSPAINRRFIVPMLDLAQATPTFAYLVPMLMFFGTNPVSALLSVVIYAMPPMVRNTTLGLQQVPSEVQDFGRMAGCTRRQHMWRILLPSARKSIMDGLNQTNNAAMNMVIIASLIGAPGLGQDVLLALGSQKIGVALEAGIAIVLIAIAFDRLIKAIAAQPPSMYRPGLPIWRRYPLVLQVIAVLLATTLLALAIPELGKPPKSMTVTTAPYVDATVKWVTRTFFDYIEAVRVFIVLNILKPTKAFLLALPWIAVAGMLGLAGWQLGGARLAAPIVAMTLFCAATGLWKETMITVYLCGVSSFVSCLIGMPLGVLAARNETANNILGVVVDTLQTIPLFVLLIPAVMLLRVGDVAAMLGIVLYAVTPAIFYTNQGIREVPPSLVEAASMAGCTRRQLLWRVQMPLALPKIMLGVNQVLMFAIAMDIIAAMIGTQDLGQAIFKARAKADAGLGIVAGLAVAFIGITADRLIGAWSRRVKERYGLD